MKKLEGYSEVELKAEVYDNLATIEQSQTNIKALNNELAKRQSQTITNLTEEPVEPSQEDIKKEEVK